MHDDLGYDRIVRCNPERMPGVDRNRLGWIVDLIENADFERGIGLKKIRGDRVEQLILGVKMIVKRGLGYSGLADDFQDRRRLDAFVRDDSAPTFDQ